MNGGDTARRKKPITSIPPFAVSSSRARLSSTAPYAEGPLALPLAYLVLPIALHKATRDQLPGNASAAFAGWVAEHGTALAGFAERVARLAPITREALLLLLQHRAIRVENGELTIEAKRIRLSAAPDRRTDDTDEARAAAELLGRWFARQRQPSLVMQGLGVKPSACSCAASPSTHVVASGRR